MQLKDYQLAALSTLRSFLEEAQIHGAAKAFEDIVGESEQAKRLGKLAGRYEAKEGLPDAPYVCLRLPTGGGKTILAAYSINIAKETWLERDFPLVLWLTPSNTIRQQTVDALKNTGHAYRKVLDDAFDGRVRVFDISDFTQLRPHDLRSNLCVVVGTIQTLRIKNTEGRKVYAHHEELEPYFTNVPANAPGLERLDNGNGSIKFSFANLLHIERPLMIVDEAHNAMTGLTVELQQRVNPAAIIEFTATPRLRSNTIHSSTAQELKSEEMIKLPIRLEEHKTWQQAVTSAIVTRQSVAEEARKDRDYIRPLILFQAQSKDREVTVEKLRAHLIESENIDPEQIAVATGDQRDLEKINLFDPDCKIRFIITIEALKEGWDCSFAYVFCSVANVKSEVAAEQLLGRVLRMPYAKARKSLALNKAYAHVVSDRFGHAAEEMVESLEKMGFSEEEAEDAVERATQQDLGEGLFGRRAVGPTKAIPLQANLSAVTAAVAQSNGKISAVAHENGDTVITLKGLPSKEAIDAIVRALPAGAAKGFAEAAAAYLKENEDRATPAERGEIFCAPRLVAEIQGEFVWADTDAMLEFIDWKLSDYPAEFSAAEFDIQRTGDAFEIDLNGEAVIYRTAANQSELSLRGGVANWTREQLIRSLDKLARDTSISQPDLIAWLSRAVGHLMDHRRLRLEDLMECKYILSRKINERIQAIKDKVRREVYQTALFGPDSRPAVSFEDGFCFKDDLFWNVRKQPVGKFVFQKHFTGAENVPFFDGKEDGEEFRCAQMIDSLDEVEYWVRNVARHDDAFWLPLEDGRTYPDFVAKLKDGRIFIIEYKGEGYKNQRAAAAAAIGAKWEEVSEGRGQYIMAEKKKNGLDIREQLLAKIGG